MDFEEQCKNTAEALEFLQQVPDNETVQSAIKLHHRFREIQHQSKKALSMKRPSLAPDPILPSNPLMYTAQIQLYNAWCLGKTALLTAQVYKSVNNDKARVMGWKPDMPHRHILQDFQNNSGRTIGFLLVSQHPEIISALIRNDLVYQRYNDKDFARMYVHHSANRSLKLTNLRALVSTSIRLLSRHAASMAIPSSSVKIGKASIKTGLAAVSVIINGRQC